VSGERHDGQSRVVRRVCGNADDDKKKWTNVLLIGPCKVVAAERSNVYREWGNGSFFMVECKHKIKIFQKKKHLIKFIFFLKKK